MFRSPPLYFFKCNGPNQYIVQSHIAKQSLGFGNISIQFLNCTTQMFTAAANKSFGKNYSFLTHIQFIIVLGKMHYILWMTSPPICWNKVRLGAKGGFISFFFTAYKGPSIIVHIFTYDNSYHNFLTPSLPLLTMVKKCWNLIDGMIWVKHYEQHLIIDMLLGRVTHGLENFLWASMSFSTHKKGMIIINIFQPPPSSYDRNYNKWKCWQLWTVPKLVW